MREAREGGSHRGKPLKSARARKDFLFWKFFFRHVLGSFRDVKMYSEQKRFMGQDFYKHPPNLLSLFQDNFSSQSKSHSADSVFLVIFDEKVKKKAFFWGRQKKYTHTCKILIKKICILLIGLSVSKRNNLWKTLSWIPLPYLQLNHIMYLLIYHFDFSNGHTVQSSILIGLCWNLEIVL